jgi:hypothetical protein
MRKASSYAGEQGSRKAYRGQTRQTMAMLCVRNTLLETIRAGETPVTKTGDWRDVTVVDADGNRIPWTDVSHISDDEMRDLMRDIVNRLYTFRLCADEPALQAEIGRCMTVAGKWDEPEFDRRMLKIEGQGL